MYFSEPLYEFNEVPDMQVSVVCYPENPPIEEIARITHPEYLEINVTADGTNPFHKEFESKWKIFVVRSTDPNTRISYVGHEFSIFSLKEKEIITGFSLSHYRDSIGDSGDSYTGVWLNTIILNTDKQKEFRFPALLLIYPDASNDENYD